MTSTFSGCKISSLFGNANSANTSSIGKSVMVSNSVYDKCVQDTEEEFLNMGAYVPLSVIMCLCRGGSYTVDGSCETHHNRGTKTTLKTVPINSKLLSSSSNAENKRYLECYRQTFQKLEDDGFDVSFRDVDCICKGGSYISDADCGFPPSSSK